MIVYRVEDEHGGGPYNGTRAPEPFTAGWVTIINGATGERGNDPVNQPSPYIDIPEWKTPFEGHKRFRFGFKTVEQMHNWFHDEARAELDRRGLKWAQYEVPDEWVDMGGHQVAFNYMKAKLVDRVPLPAAGQGELFTKTSSDGKRSTEVDIPF